MDFDGAGGGARDPGQVPPLATARVDVDGAALVERWITELSDCP